jgi:hypothetical protein
VDAHGRLTSVVFSHIRTEYGLCRIECGRNSGVFPSCSIPHILPKARRIPRKTTWHLIDSECIVLWLRKLWTDEKPNPFFHLPFLPLESRLSPSTDKGSFTHTYTTLLVKQRRSCSIVKSPGQPITFQAPAQTRPLHFRARRNSRKCHITNKI